MLPWVRSWADQAAVYFYEFANEVCFRQDVATMPYPFRPRVNKPRVATRRMAGGLVFAGVLSGAGALSGNFVQAQVLNCKAVSPPRTQLLVELFTSEGCSSCPPADRWLNALAQVPRQKLQAVALSLHVDYWDYIGWKDPFAKRLFTERQYSYARQRGASGVYTPQVVLGGKDFPHWDSPPAFFRAAQEVNERPARVQIELDGQAGKLGGAIVLKYQSPGEQAGQLNLVLFESALRSKVAAGENRGETLVHDRVAREWFKPEQRSGVMNIALAHGQRIEQSGIAAFVQTGSGDVLQAVSCEFRP